MNIMNEEHEYRKPDDVHQFRAQRKSVQHPVNQKGGDERWYQ